MGGLSSTREKSIILRPKNYKTDRKLVALVKRETSHVLAKWNAFASFSFFNACRGESRQVSSRVPSTLPDFVLKNRFFFEFSWTPKS